MGRRRRRRRRFIHRTGAREKRDAFYEVELSMIYEFVFPLPEYIYIYILLYYNIISNVYPLNAKKKKIDITRNKTFGVVLIIII